MPLRISKSGSTIATFKILNFDSDAQTFLTAAGITNSTQQNAINKLTIDLKYYGLWTKQKAIYPVVGGVASSHAVNLKTPGTYNLTFSTNWTHSSTGMTPSNAYANTYITPPSINQNSECFTAYLRLDKAFALGTADVGYNYMSTFGTTFNSPLNISPNYIEVSSTITSKNGYFIGNRTSSTNISLYKNSTKLTNVTATSGTRDAVPIYIGALNRNTSIAFPSESNEFAFASIGDGLTDQDAINFYNIVQRYQINLGRQV